MMRRHACALLLGLCAACERPGPRMTRFEGATMGTTYDVQVVDAPAALDPSGLHAQVHGVLSTIEGRMSTYDPESEVSRFNASDSTDWFDVSEDTLWVIEEAHRISRLTGGTFDVTVGPLVELWGFGARPGNGPPAPELIATVLEDVGFDLLETRASPPAIRKRVAKLRIDLSAIAKGFAVDEVARVLEAQGLRRFLVEVGGELRARGSNLAGQPWLIAVEQPQHGQRAAACHLHLVDRAVASSGDYRKVLDVAGVRTTHVIDPRTGQPVSTGVSSATVLSPSAIEADAFATALMVLPPETGLRLAEQQGLAARLLVREGAAYVERMTPCFPELTPGGRP